MKILVIEDQEMPWSNFKIVLLQICKMREEDIERARWLEEAEAKLRTDEYDLILLDHRMPYDDPGCTDQSDFDLFVGKLDNIGYRLLPLIKKTQPKAVVVGTSSLSADELRFYEAPSRSMSKLNAFEELPKLIDSLRQLA